MQCAVCGAPTPPGRAHCQICGRALDGRQQAQGPTPGSAARTAPSLREWDREPEAAAYEDVLAALEEGEQILSVARGRAAGSWRDRLFLGPKALVSPFLNIGLTARRIIVQPISPLTGRSTGPGAASIPLSAVASIAIADSDETSAGPAARMLVGVREGVLRVRVVGRQVEAAREMAQLRDALSGAGQPGSESAAAACAQCGKLLEPEQRFCPFCGKEQRS